MITEKELQASNYKRTERGDTFKSEGKYYILSPKPEDIFDHSIYIIKGGKIYRTTSRLMERNKYTLGSFELKVEEDAHNTLTKAAERKDSTSTR